MAGGEDQPPKDQAQGAWNYHPEGAPADTATPSLDAAAVAPADDNAVDWSASEFIVHEKSPLWYLILAGATSAVAAAIYFLTRDAISVVAVVILAAVLGVAASRKPRIIEYRVDRGGITVGRQFHPYGHFKSFALIDEGAFTSVTVLPLKRFAMPLSIYFSPEDEPRIMDVLANHLPVEPGELDSIDRFMRNIHF
jgi:hypothetical protein